MIVINREFITALLESHDEQVLYSMALKLGETVARDTISGKRSLPNDQS